MKITFLPPYFYNKYFFRYGMFEQGNFLCEVKLLEKFFLLLSDTTLWKFDIYDLSGES
jgi:hypothetical protein